MNTIVSARARVLGALLAIGWAHAIAAQDVCTLTVTGQNDPAVDVSAVTAAVNSPALSGDATVCLEGKFDFGAPVFPTVISVAIVPNPTVVSLKIVGLDDANGHKATIRGGVQALTLAPPAAVAHFVIENLRFDQPAFSAISILRSNESVRISGVRVVGAQSYLFAAFNARFREAISVSSALATIAGDIEISNSVLDGGTYTADDTTLAVSAAIALTGAVAGGANQPFTARVRVADNKLVNWSGSGILAGGIREATLERNRIEPGAFANLLPGCASPTNGLGAGNGISLASVVDSTIRDNVIVLEPALTGAGTVPPCTAGFVLTGALAGSADGNIVYRNRIRGQGTHAIVVGAPTGSSEADNLFAINPVANFVPAVSTLLLEAGANDNTFVGTFPSITGNTAGNLIITR